MPQLVDTTIRLLSQEPLAGRLPTAEILRVAEILDQAGFACLEVSGGGVFDATVRRRVESPWERVRAIKARVSTPLGIALRGRFLVGSSPVSGDIVTRFVASAAANGVEVFRLHDPLNDVSNLREAGAAITSAGGAFHAGLVYSPGRTGETETLVRQAREPAMIRLARDATRRAVERSFAMPLRAAGVDATVSVRFADEAQASTERWDTSRSLQDVLGNRN